MTSIQPRLVSMLTLALMTPFTSLGCAADIDSVGSEEVDELNEVDEIASAEQAITVSDLAYQIVNLRNQYGCPTHSRCDQHVSWSATGSVVLYPKDNTQDLVPWRLIPVPGTTDEFYLRNEWQCPNESRCDAHLSWSGTNALLMPKENTADLVPWKFIPVPGTTDQFYIRNRWNCNVGDSRCNNHLSWTGSQLQLYPANNTADLVPWKVVTSAAPSDRFGTYFRSRGAGGKPPISYSRGVGTVPTTCASGMQRDADGLCYTPCSSGYTGVGPVCWGTCPSGYADHGATCYRGAEVISANTSNCPWYDIFAVSGCSVCPSGYINDGLTCRIDASVIGKSSYGRGVGVSPSICTGDKVWEAGLCYSSCDPGYKGVGADCWVDSFAGLCIGLYDPVLARDAVASQGALTFGIGAGMASGASVGVESGVAYGENGEYGCYVQTCTGAVTSIGISAWTALGFMNEFSQVEGNSTVTSAGTSAGIVGASVAIVSSGTEIQGYQESLSLGVGVSPIVEIGVQSCNATVTRLW